MNQSCTLKPGTWVHWTFQDAQYLEWLLFRQNYIHTWEQLLITTWRDRVHPLWPVNIIHVAPDPQRTQHGGHLIVLQHEHPEEAAVLLSNYRGEVQNRFAQLVNQRLTFERLLWFHDHETWCERPDQLCIGAYGNQRILPTEVWDARNGQHLELFVHTLDFSDDVSMMQHSSTPQQHPQLVAEAPATEATVCPSAHMNANAAPFIPGEPSIHEQLEFIQDLYQLWADSAFAWDTEERSNSFAVWFVDHRWTWPHGRFYRTVRLYEDFTSWHETIINTWREYVQPGMVIEPVIVHPKPHDLDRTIAGHIILIQAPKSDWVTSLVTAFDPRRTTVNGDFTTHQMAVTTHEHILLDNLLLVLGLHATCLGRTPTLQCQARYLTEELLPGRPLPGRSGYGITMQLRERPRETEAPVLLQLHTALFHSQETSCERQTTDTVAHGQWPQQLWMQDFPTVGERQPHDWAEPNTTILVQLAHNAPPHLQDLIPPYVEVSYLYQIEDIRTELAAWGFRNPVFLCGHHDTAYVHFDNQRDADHIDYVYCNHDAADPHGVLHRAERPDLQEIDHMRFLHSRGFAKVIVRLQEQWTEEIFCIHFENVQPQQEQHPHAERVKTPWTPPQSRQTNFSEPLPHHQQLLPCSPCILHFDLQELDRFLDSARQPLWTDYTAFDLPDFVREALDQCVSLERWDRYVIYVDGSSQTKHRHRPPAWIAEKDVSDSWAFAVFAEQYGDTPDQPSRMQFLGWQTQVVLYEEDAPHHLGTTWIGADGAEVEALCWAGLWRLARNDRRPTVFRSDSRLAGDQAAGRIGSLRDGLSYRHLRATFQALSACLPGDHLLIDHVRGHTGDPYNELVDWLAKREGLTSLYLPRQPIHMGTFSHVLRHLWMAVKDQPDVPRLTQKGFDIGNIALPQPQHPRPPQDQPTTWKHTQFSISAATANVRTFYRGTEGHSGKLGYVREQFVQHKLNFLGLQECRTDCGSSCQQDVLRLAGGGDRGNYGIEIWANLQQPICRQGKRWHYLNRKDFVVVSYDPRHLLVHVHNELIDLWLLAAHAPHSDGERDIREHWWRSLSDIIQHYAPHGPIIVMIDANAATGARDDHHIFDNDDKSTPNTVFFRDFLSDHELCAPSTLPLHQGPTHTWICPTDESQHRIDYVLIPCAWRRYCTHSEGLVNLDFGHLGDHQATAVQLEWQECAVAQVRQQIGARHDRTKIAKTDLSASLKNYQPPPWHTDIESQVDDANSHILTTLRERCPTTAATPKKSFITEEIWETRRCKLKLQKRRQDLTRLLRREALCSCLGAWKRSKNPIKAIENDMHFNFATSLTVSKFTTGWSLFSVTKKLRRQIVKAKQHAIREAIEVLPEDCAASHILYTLKPLLGPTNHQKKKATTLPMVRDEQGVPCSDPESLRDRWIDFFRVMEGGERLSHEELREKWIKALEEFRQDELSLVPADLPSLTDLEIAYRRIRCHKAIGDDMVPPELCHFYPTEMARITFCQMAKLCTHGQETLSHKGGVLVAAWKRKGAQDRCEAYRSLLISSHVAKALHGAVRTHQSTIYEAFLQAQQIGGRKHLPVTLGVHYIRAAARNAQASRKSHAMIFLDLREAFYRVLRPIPIGGAMPDALLASIAERLHLPHDALADLHQILQEPSSAEQAGMPAHMRRALQALHTNTNFHMKGQTDRVHTLIGSRPGDPFADVVFGYMFSRILLLVEQKLRDLDILEVIHDSPDPGLFPTLHDAAVVPHPVLGPTWMDDLCITVSHDTASGLERKAGAAASILLETCTAHGVTPNLDRGKSEILFTFRGPGSRALRTKYFSVQQGRLMPVLTEYGWHQISVVGNYTHLGSNTHHTGLSHKEVRKRIALGNSSFAAHRKILFQNPAFSIARRAQLFQSIVLSKIIYGMESWTMTTLKQRNYFRAAMLRLYRRLSKTPPTAHISDDDVLAQVNLIDPIHLPRIARLRYLGLLYKCETVTPWALLRADGEWLQLVRQDLQWLWNLISGTCKLRDPSQHFAEWEYLLRYHRSYWKKLLRRGEQLCILKQKDTLLLRKLHHDVFARLEEHGTFATTPIRPSIDEHQQSQHYGCMQCSKRCRTKAGEGAHMFRVHGVMAKERQWIAGTACEACLKEYHSFDKLQTHLRTAIQCRAVLAGKPGYQHPAPGHGSLLNRAKREEHDGLLPVQQGSGPLPAQGQLQEEDRHHLPLFEALALAIYEIDEHQIQNFDTILQDIVQKHSVSWSTTQVTLHHMAASFTDEAMMDIPVSRRFVLRAIDKLLDPYTWPFLQGVNYEHADGQHLHHLDLYEQWCEDLVGLDSPWTAHTPTPSRQIFKERIILHAYSGRRRPGDLQWFIDEMAKKNDLTDIYVVSLDLVINEVWGDISRPATQAMWFDALRLGHVVGFLAGPPCCTWSVARGKVDQKLQSTGRTGPRVIRTLHKLWGFDSLSLREMKQIMDGHLLLGFSVYAMVLLYFSGGAGVLEHPGEPSDPDAASIWRLPLMKLLLQLPGFRLLTCAQGLLGATSTKRTGLLALNLPYLHFDLRDNAVCKELPKQANIGLDEAGNFRTAVRKDDSPLHNSACDPQTQTTQIDAIRNFEMKMETACVWKWMWKGSRTSSAILFSTGESFSTFRSSGPKGVAFLNRPNGEKNFCRVGKVSWKQGGKDEHFSVEHGSKTLPPNPWDGKRFKWNIDMVDSRYKVCVWKTG